MSTTLTQNKAEALLFDKDNIVQNNKPNDLESVPSSLYSPEDLKKKTSKRKIRLYNRNTITISLGFK